MTIGVLAAPVTWAAPSPSPADGSAPGLGGWTISASAAPITMEIYDPKIPIPAQPGKPNLEFDLSYTRASYGSGPTGAATASWLWPGDAIAFGLGQLFNNPTLKYPMLTNVQFPGATPDATMQPIPGSYMQSHTDTNGSTSVSTFGLPLPGTGPTMPGATPTSAPSSAPSSSSSGGLLGGLLGGTLPQPQVPNLDLGTLLKFLTGQSALVDVQGERSQSSATVANGKAVATAESDAGKLLLLGGLIEFDGLKVTSQSTSDGVKGAATGNVDYGSMSVAGIPFGITANGIQTPSGLIALPQLPDTLNQVLAPVGISIAMPAAGDVSKDTAGEMFSHGLQITIDTAKLKAALPLGSTLLNQLFAQIPPQLMNQLTQSLPAPVGSVLQTLPQLSPKIVLTIGSAKSKADASQAIDLSGGVSGGPTSQPSSSAGSSGGGTPGGTTGGSVTGGSGTSGTTGGSGGTVGGTGGGTVGGSGGTTGGTAGGATGGTVPSPPMQNTATKVAPAAFGGLPGRLLLGAAVIACLAAWGLRKYSTLLFGGAGCEAGHSTGVPDLREFDE